MQTETKETVADKTADGLTPEQRQQIVREVAKFKARLNHFSKRELVRACAKAMFDLQMLLNAYSDMKRRLEQMLEAAAVQVAAQAPTTNNTNTQTPQQPTTATEP